MTNDPTSLDRFVTAQSPVFSTVLEELTRGQKRSHWMWFIFPQLRGLGHSAMARFYGLESLEESRSYLQHPLLGPRLEQCTRAVLSHPDRSLLEIFGTPDDWKFLSSMTVFSLASSSSATPFHDALARWNGGKMDVKTLALLSAEKSGG